MDSAQKSPSLKSLDSGKGSSRNVRQGSMESLHSSTGSQFSITSSSQAGDEPKKKKSGFGSFRRKKKVDGNGGETEVKKSKSLNPFRKKSKQEPRPEEVAPPKPVSSNPPPLEVVPEDPSNPNDPQAEIKKLKKKLSLIRSFRRKSKGGNATVSAQPAQAQAQQPQEPDPGKI